MKKSCFGKKLCSFKFLCDVTDFHVHKKQKITDINQNQKDFYIIFDFLKDNAMVHVCGNFVVCSMSLSNFMVEKGVEFLTVLWNLKRISTNEKGKLIKPVSEIFSKKLSYKSLHKFFSIEVLLHCLS